MKAEDRILSKRYARGYLALEERGVTKQGEAAAASAIEELAAVRDALARFRGILLHPLVGYDDKHEVLARLLPEKLMLSRAAVFARLLIREHRFYLLDRVIEDCGELFNAYAGILPAKAYSRHPLDQEELRRAAGALSAATGKTVRLSNPVSESVVGGVEIRMGDLLIDSTVKGRLERLRKGVLTE